MKKTGRVAFVFIFFLLSACGVKGPLQPPLVLIPRKIEAIKTFQQEERIILKWTTPLVYENGLAMSTWPVVEIWGLEFPLEPDFKETVEIRLKEMIKKSRLLAEVKLGEKESGLTLPEIFEASWEYPFNLEKSGELAFLFELRLRDERGRKSGFSDPVVIIPVTPPLPPHDLKAEVQENKILLRWEAPSEAPRPEEKEIVYGYHVYRKEDSGGWSRLNSELLRVPQYEDQSIVMGKTYFYAVRAVRIIDAIERESEASEELKIEMKDIFPPPPPSGVIALAGEDRIILSWEPSLSPDLAGYLIRRRAEDEATYELLTSEPILATSYEDFKVEKGKSYYYAITACDQAGNESRPVEIKASLIKDKES